MLQEISVTNATLTLCNTTYRIMRKECPHSLEIKLRRSITMTLYKNMKIVRYIISSYACALV